MVVYIIPPYFTVLQQVNRSYIIRGTLGVCVCASSRVDDYTFFFSSLLIFFGEISLSRSLSTGCYKFIIMQQQLQRRIFQKEEEKEWNVRNRLWGGAKLRKKCDENSVGILSLLLLCVMKERNKKNKRGEKFISIRNCYNVIKKKEMVLVVSWWAVSLFFEMDNTRTNGVKVNTHTKVVCTVWCIHVLSISSWRRFSRKSIGENKKRARVCV